MNKFILNPTLLVVQIVTISVSGEQILDLQTSSDSGAITAKLIKSCYEDRVEQIGLSGNVSDAFIASMSRGSPISTILFNGDGRSGRSGVESKECPHKLQIFVLAATSSMELEGILIDIKNSRWWNHMAQFYVFDSVRRAAGCAEASRFLWTVWTMDILRAKFICDDEGEGTLIYTFNPYTQSAPAPWGIERIEKGVNDHPWTLLVRKLDENVNICESIDFDQTRNPGGYVVRLTTSECQFLSIDTNEFSKYEFRNKILQTIAQHMNITFKMVCHPENESLEFIDEQGIRQGMLNDLTYGRSDLLPYTRSVTARTQLNGAYPILHARFFAVTQYTSYKSQWQKIITVIDRSSRISLCIVILVNVIFLKYALRQSLMIAALNTVRMICNSCFTKLPNNIGPRIYLACLFCFVVTIQALYQGQLAALLTKHIRYPNINNERDLIQSDHAIYGIREDTAVFDTEIFKGRFTGMDFGPDKCTDYVLKNSSIACVGFRDWLINDTIESKLHMSKNAVYQIYMFWPNRNDWPLQDKADRHNFYYVESGLFDHDQATIYQKPFRILDSNENKGSGQKFQVLTLEDLAFAFTILAFGLACATIIFFIELLSLERRRLIKIKYK